MGESLPRETRLALLEPRDSLFNPGKTKETERRPSEYILVLLHLAPSRLAVCNLRQLGLPEGDGQYVLGAAPLTQVEQEAPERSQRLQSISGISGSPIDLERVAGALSEKTGARLLVFNLREFVPEIMVKARGEGA